MRLIVALGGAESGEATLVFDTSSERDFHDFCRAQNWDVEKLEHAKAPGTRTPDFLVTTSTGFTFVAEVTEFERQPPFKPGEIRSGGHTLGNPIRAKLHEKKGQLKAYSDLHPTLIVIAGQHSHMPELEPESFDSALYGDLAVTVKVPKNYEVDPYVEDGPFNSGRRFFGPSHNTSISAVAALNGAPQVLRVYHNKYARNPLEIGRLIINTERVEHYVKSSLGEIGWTRA